MVADYRKLFISIVEKFTSKQPGIDHDVFTRRRKLDGKFPEGGCAENGLVLQVVDQISSKGG
jgi:hypothetical protein